MNYSKVMLRVFSSSETDKDFQKKFGEALDLAETEGSAKLQSDEGDAEKVDLQVDKNDDGSFTITDNVNDEVTTAKVNDSGDTVLEKQESDPEPTPDPAPDEEQEVDKAVVTEVTPNEEYKVTTKDTTFSVKGNLKKAIATAKKFSDYVEMDLTEVGDNMEPSKQVPATTGINDPEKAGTPSARSFSDGTKTKAIHNALEAAEKAGKPYTAEDIAKKIGCKVEDVQEAMKSFSDTTEYTVEFKHKNGSQVKAKDVKADNPEEARKKAEELLKNYGSDWSINEISLKTLSDTGEKDTVEEALEAAKEHAKKDEDGAIVKTESATVHVTYDEGSKKFSYTKIDMKSRQFSDIPEDDIVAELDGTNIDPEKEMPADKGIIDPEKAGTPAARQFSQEQVDAALAKDAKDETEDDKKALKEAADAGCEKSKAKLAEIQACGTQRFSDDLEGEVDKLEEKAEEVSKEPTEENAQSLKKDAEELQEKVESNKKFSEVKKESLIGRLQLFSKVADIALKNAMFSPAQISEEENRQFSALMQFETKQFASKEEIEAATKAFSQTEGAAENPCLTTQF